MPRIVRAVRNRVSTEHRAAVVFAFFAVAPPAVIGVVVGLITNEGRDVNLEFSIAVSQILPVLFLAAILESRVSVVVALQRLGNPGNATLLMSSMRGLVALFVVGEATALYSVASQTATTFLVVTPSLAMLMMVRAMIGEMRYVIGGNSQD